VNPELTPTADSKFGRLGVSIEVSKEIYVTSDHRALDASFICDTITIGDESRGTVFGKTRDVIRARIFPTLCTPELGTFVRAT